MMARPTRPSKLSTLARDASVPGWLRSLLWIVLVAMQVGSLSLQISNLSQFSQFGNNVYIVCVGIVNAATAVALLVIGIQELRAAAKTTGKQTFASQLTVILLRTFLFLLLPCMAITAILVTWALLTHQPAFTSA